EFAVFNRPLSADEAALLHKKPGMLEPLKRAAPGDKPGQGPPGNEAEVRAYHERVRFSIAAELVLPDDKRRQTTEALVAVLADLVPRGGEPPTPPKFPFDAEAARRYQKEYASWRGLPPEITNSLGMTFVLIPPGTFLMGSPASEPGHNAGG